MDFRSHIWISGHTFGVSGHIFGFQVTKHRFMVVKRKAFTIGKISKTQYI